MSVSTFRIVILNKPVIDSYSMWKIETLLRRPRVVTKKEKNLENHSLDDHCPEVLRDFNIC